VRRVRYQVACSLDGFIAGPNGEIDWIPNDPDIDFASLLKQFDTLLMGRRTYETLPSTEGLEGKRIVVFSRTLRPEEHPGVTVARDLEAEVKRLRSEDGKDVWLFGGGELFRSLLELDCVDTVEPAIIPVILGGGVPMLPSPGVQRRLRLTGHRVYPKSGIVLLEYAVRRAVP
jgi:dihydrofolate reductase